MIVVAAAAALALGGVALLGVQGDAAAEEPDAPHGPMTHERGQDHAHRHAPGAQSMRTEHLADLAGRLGIDPDAFVEAMSVVRAEFALERDAMRAQMAELDPAERREAMQAFAAERQAQMADALAELGVDPATLAEHRAEHREGHDRPARDHGSSPRGQHRMAGVGGQV
jgi:hypothetical protein